VPTIVALFDISVNVPLRVGLGLSPRELLGDGGGRPGVERAAGQAIGQTLPVHKFRDVIEAFVGLADIEDLDDARVADARQQLGFALEAPGPIWILGPPGLDHLDGHEPLEAAVPSAVDTTECALAEHGGELVAVIQSEA
jgi:hypothetical protein